MANTPPTGVTEPLQPPAAPPPQAPPQAVIDVPGETVPEPAPDPDEKVFSPKEILAYIRDDLGLEEDEYHSILGLRHFEYGGAKWVVDQPIGNSESLILFMVGTGPKGDKFEDHAEGDLRAYVYPRGATNPKAPEWLVYVFNRVHPGASTKAAVSQSTWLELVAFEKRAAAEVLGILEDEEKIDEVAVAAEDAQERCVTWLRANALDNAAKRMLEQFEKEDEEGNDEDEDDEEDD